MRALQRYSMSLLIGGVFLGGLVGGMMVSTRFRPPLLHAQAVVTTGAAMLAATPRLQYQGQLLNPTTGKPVTNGAYAMTFRLYAVATGGSALWGETQSVNTTDGLFSTLLTVDGNQFNGQELYLGIQVGSDPEATPRQPIAYTGYAFRADRAGVADSSTVAQNALNADVLDGIDSSGFVRRGNDGIVAYGVVDSNGARIDGPSFSSSRDGNGVYVISISGETYHLNDFVTIVTSITNNECPEPMLVSTGSSNGNLLVDIFDRNGNRRACKFHFMTIEP
ncbi:MAG: hypothetical protein KF832_14615 [Caldilineaceae bacterium]|nr:hypothetical protein [Caldilineaceae bacterium]